MLNLRKSEESNATPILEINDLRPSLPSKMVSPLNASQGDLNYAMRRKMSSRSYSSVNINNLVTSVSFNN